MTLAETTQSRIRRPRSAGDLDVLKLVRLGVWVAFCVLLIVLR
jgi:hypothetical protein